MSAVATKGEIKNLAARPGGGKTTTKRVAREKILARLCSGTIFHVFRRFLMIFHKFSMGSSGVRSKDMDIYTFWIDLDVICSNLQEFGLVSRGSESKIESYDWSPLQVQLAQNRPSEFFDFPTVKVAKN